MYLDMSNAFDMSNAIIIYILIEANIMCT